MYSVTAAAVTASIKLHQRFGRDIREDEPTGIAPPMQRASHFYTASLLKSLLDERTKSAEPIRVKPLVWMVTDDAKLGISFTNFGQYVIDMGSTQGKFCALFNEASVVVIKDQWWFGTIDEAKATAQADYERRILAALEGGTR